jgi:transaldolase
MGASFRNLSEIEALAGCDYLTISPALLAALSKEEGILKQVLNAETVARRAERSPPLSEAAFRMDLNQDAMATEKLSEGIRLFCKDLDSLKLTLRTALT